MDQAEKIFQIGSLSNVPPEYKVPNKDPEDLFLINIKYIGSPYGMGQFYMRDAAKGLGCFYKLVSGNHLELKKNMIIRVGNEFIVTSQTKSSNIDGSSSRISVDGGQVDEIQVYGDCIPSDSILKFSLANKNRIKIGRSPTCDIIINDPLVSLSHCTLKKENDSWIAMDGSDFEPSSTGTWVYLSYSTRL